jgi:hypothetical protein
MIEILLVKIAERSHQSLITEEKLKSIYKELKLDYEGIKKVYDTKFFIAGEKNRSSVLDLINSDRISLFQLVYAQENKKTK